MTFMMTMPPTIAEIELTITNTAKNAPLIAVPQRDVAFVCSDEEVVLFQVYVTSGAQAGP